MEVGRRLVCELRHVTAETMTAQDGPLQSGAGRFVCSERRHSGSSRLDLGTVGDRRLVTVIGRWVGFRLGKDTKDITLDGNTVQGFAAKVDDKRK